MSLRCLSTCGGYRRACQIAVDNARQFIKFFALAVKHNSLIRGLSFTVTYVENAACLLFYDSLREKNETNIEYLELALYGIKQMNQKSLVPGVVATLEQILRELEQIQPTKPPETTPNRPLPAYTLSVFNNAFPTPPQPVNGSLGG